MRRGIAVLLTGEDPRDARVKATCAGDARSVKVAALPGIGLLTAGRLAAVEARRARWCSHTSLLARADQLIYTSVEGDATQTPDPA